MKMVIGARYKLNRRLTVGGESFNEGEMFTLKHYNPDSEVAALERGPTLIILDSDYLTLVDESQKIEIGKKYEATEDLKMLAKGDRFKVDSIFESRVGKETIVAITFEDGERYSDSIEQFDPNKLKEVTTEPSKPAHYDTGIDTIAFMRANCPPEQVEGFLRGNAFKYLQRYDRKSQAVSDLKKAAHYVQMLIEEVEGR